MPYSICMNNAALIYSRKDGYVDATPGMQCVLRCAGQTIRVRVRRVVAPGRVMVQWPNDVSARPSGWERWRQPIARAGRLTVVDL